MVAVRQQHYIIVVELMTQTSDWSNSSLDRVTAQVRIFIFFAARFSSFVLLLLACSQSSSWLTFRRSSSQEV
jgi:hypothetical protein